MIDSLELVIIELGLVKSKVERWLFDGLAVEIDLGNFEVVLPQNGDCKGNIDVVDMVWAHPVLGLLRGGLTSKFPLAVSDAKIGDVKTTDNEETGGWILV